MTFLHTIFERSNQLYSQWFADWLHINFLIRTALLILLLWLVVYIGAQVFRYIVAPLLLLFYIHALFRAWNYLMIETPQEWLYLRGNQGERYLRLCDKVKKNRMVVSHSKYAGMIRRTKPAAYRLMIICGTAATLWAASFGLHQEYAIPVMLPDAIPNTTAQPQSTEPGQTEQATAMEQAPQAYSACELSPSTWPNDADIVLYLNTLGAAGSRLRNGPGITGFSVIELLWDNDKMVYLHHFVPDTDIEGLYWLHVLSPSGTEGFISSQLVGAKF